MVFASSSYLPKILNILDNCLLKHHRLEGLCRYLLIPDYDTNSLISIKLEGEEGIILLTDRCTSIGMSQDIKEYMTLIVARYEGLKFYNRF